MYLNGYISKRKRKKRANKRAAGHDPRSVLRQIKEDIFAMETNMYERAAFKVRKYEARFRGGSHIVR